MSRPRTSSTDPDRGSRRILFTTVAVSLALILAAVASCQGQTAPETPSVRDRLSESSIAGADRLRIGVYEDSPLMGQTDPTGRRAGFEIDLARGIAGFLGFTESRIDWIPVVTADRETALLRGEVDFVVASFSITEERKQRVRFAGPYLVTTQEIIVPSGLADEITEIDHLRDPKLRICATGASTAKERLVEEGITVATVARFDDCVRGLLEGRFQAMSSDETVLAGIRSQHPDKLTIVDLPFGESQLLGIAVPRHDPALQDLIGHYLLRNYEDAANGSSTAWQAAYDRNLEHWLGPATQPYPVDVPRLTDHADWNVA